MRDTRAPFLIAASYLAALLLIRLSVIIAGSAESEFAAAAKAGELPDAYFYIGTNVILFGYHIHHFYFGIFFICLAGWLAIVESPRVNNTYIAIMYGAGLGLFFDEIGLLLTWGDYYSSLSYTLSAIVLGIFLNILFFGQFWRSVRENLATTHARTPILRYFRRGLPIPRAIDWSLSRTSDSERVSLVLNGALHVSVGALILLYPRLVYYLVAFDFIVSGVLYLVRPLLTEERSA